jgi:hypothetical protein
MTLMLVPKCEGLFTSSEISRMGSNIRDTNPPPPPGRITALAIGSKSFTARTIDVKRYKG